MDRRSDMWAFGCVLYEMLTGRQAFSSGETVADTLAGCADARARLGRTPGHHPTNGGIPHPPMLEKGCAPPAA